MTYRRAFGAVALSVPLNLVAPKPVVPKIWAPPPVVPNGTWSDTPDGPVWTPGGTAPPPGTVPQSDGNITPLHAAVVAQSSSGVPVMLVAGGLAVAGFLVYRHFKKKGTTS